MKSKLIACRVMIDELLRFLPEGIETEVLEISQHIRPKLLKESLQNAISRADGRFDQILLGYGLCSNAVVGLQAKHSRLVIPKMHDCIGIFLGSHQAYVQEKEKEAGTYFLTQGYIRGYQKENDGPMGDYERVATKYGRAKADTIVGKMMQSYKRLVYIRTSEATRVEDDREYSRSMAERFGMRYEELDSSSRLLQKLIAGEWNEEFVVVEPGRQITLEEFLN